MIYEVLNASVPFFEAIMHFLMFSAFMTRRSRCKIGQLFLGVLGLGILISFSNHYFAHTSYNLILILLFAYAACMFFYDASIAKRIIVVLLTSFISMMLENLSAYLVALVCGISLDTVVDQLEYRAWGILLSKGLGILVCNTIRIKSDSKRILMGKSYWTLLLLLFASALFAAFLIFRMTYELDQAAYNVMAVICAVGLFFSAFVALYFYENAEKKNEATRLQEKYKQQLHSQFQHARELVAKQKEILATKHDMKNQLVTIQGLLTSGGVEEGSAYISHLLEGLEAKERLVDTGNFVLDSMLSTKKALAEQKGITFNMRLQISQEIGIKPVDQCIIFGNALDNAIEACERCKKDNRRIDLLLFYQNHKLVFRLTNTIPPNHSKKLLTQKSDKENHGFGLYNIRNALAKYNSEPVIEQTTETFALGFVIFDENCIENETSSV